MIHEFWLWQVPEYADWGWIIALYLFLGGVGGGAYVTAAAAEVLGKGYEGIARAGAYLSPFILIIGSAILLVDLGDPVRGIMVPVVFVNPTSWMAIGAWLLLILIVLGIFYAITWKIGASREKRLKLAVIGAPIGVAVGAYTGFLLSAAEFVPLWHTTLIPLLFTISALSTGLVGTCLLAMLPFFGESIPELQKGTTLFSRLDAGLIIAELAVILVLLEVLESAGGAALISLNLMTTGEYAAPFWGGVIFLGLLVPLFCRGVSLLRKTLRARYVAFEFGLVLLGGLVLRFVIIFAAVKQPIVIP